MALLVIGLARTESARKRLDFVFYGSRLDPVGFGHAEFSARGPKRKGEGAGTCMLFLEDLFLPHEPHHPPATRHPPYLPTPRPGGICVTGTWGGSTSWWNLRDGAHGLGAHPGGIWLPGQGGQGQLCWGQVSGGQKFGHQIPF